MFTHMSACNCFLANDPRVRGMYGYDASNHGYECAEAVAGVGMLRTRPDGIVLTWSLRFTGKERDSETGLDYFGARYLSGVQGRWTSPDWSATPQPVPYASLGDPQTLNLYTYVRNNPLNAVDRDGHLFREMCNWLKGNGWKLRESVTSSLVTEDPPITNPAFYAVAKGVNQAGPVVNTMAAATPAVPLLAFGAAAGLGLSSSAIAAASTTGIAAATSPVGQRAVNTVVYLGGEGEVAGAINVQGPWALASGWGASASNVAGQTLSQLQQAGNRFIIASNTSLPFAGQSVSTVITNNTPINANTWLGAGVQSAEVWRILSMTGTWVNNGNIQPRP